MLDQAYIPENEKPPFGRHPHRGHSVVTLLLQGKVRSWDSFGNTKHTLTGPAAYWVDAGSGVFHEESSVVDDEDDPTQHITLCQLWIGVREADRQKPARVQYQESLPVEELEGGIGTITYYVGGPGNTVETPNPIFVAMVHQHAGTTYDMPVSASHGGFIVNLSGNDKTVATQQSDAAHPATFAGITPNGTLDVLVLDKEARGDGQAHISIVASPDAPADYLVCLGERNGPEEPSFKKLVANGAIIAKTPGEARDIAKTAEQLSSAGLETGIFAPFGTQA